MRVKNLFLRIAVVVLVSAPPALALAWAVFSAANFFGHRAELGSAELPSSVRGAPPIRWDDLYVGTGVAFFAIVVTFLVFVWRRRRAA